MFSSAKRFIKRTALANPLIYLKGLATKPVSQNEEARVISDLIARHDVPRCFVEFGFSGWEFNCASLASDWDGLLIDADAYNTRIARVVLPRRVTAETTWLTLNSLERVHRYAERRQIGILSIDVDGNDYWFLENLIGLRPAIIIAEYNATFGHRPITVPYDPAFDRRTKSADWTYYGASLSALTGLAQVHGYRLVKVTKSGFNAFFLRDDLATDSDPAIDPREALNDRPMWNRLRPSECFPAIADRPFVTPRPTTRLCRGATLGHTSPKPYPRESAMPHFGDYQNELYGLGLRGILPKIPVDYATLVQRASAAMPPHVLNYVQGGCGDEWTQDSNAAAFRHWGMTPRMMVGTTNRDLSTTIFGHTYHSPLFMAPIGVTGICTQDQHGDVAAAQASAMTGVPMTVSTLGNDTLEDVAKQLGAVPGFFQLYTPRDRDLAESLIRRAEAAGYRALVVTLDTWVTGWRPRDLNAGNFPQLRGHVLANYFADPVFQKMLGKDPAAAPAEAIPLWASQFARPLTWDDMAWLKSVTKMPIVLKGICHPEDAKKAVDLGADALYVSNHGGRQANGGIAAIDMLPGVVAAAGDVPVWFDSGIRSGSDVIKALALGASAVGVGRPFVYGLALDGAAGAAHVLKCILAEADLMMAVNGMPTLDAVRAAGAERI